MIMVKAYEDPPYNENYYDPSVSDLSETEIEYLALLLTICSIPLDKAISWLKSSEGVSSLATRTLKPDFFNQIDNEITTAVTSKYPNVSEILNNSFTKGKNTSFEILNRPPVTGVADKLSLAHVEQYNFGKIRNLTEEMKNGVRETLSRGIIDNKSVEAITTEIKQLGVEPLNGKSNAQARSASIARTELTRARLAGRLQAFKYYGINKVNVVSIGDGLECGDCLDIIAHNPYTLEEIAILLPAHVNCRHDQIEPVIETNQDSIADEPIMDAGLVDVTITVSA